MELQMDQTDFATHFNFVLLGKPGSGKTASGKTLLGPKPFILKKIQDIEIKSNTVCGFPVAVFDTSGLSDKQIQTVFGLSETEYDVCTHLLVIKVGEFTEEDQSFMKKTEKLLGEDRLKNTWILFTRGDKLDSDNQTIEKWIKNTKAVKKLVQKYEDRYHVFNNKIRGSNDQVQKLIQKRFDQLIKSNPEVQKLRTRTQNTKSSKSSDRRIVLLGKTGFGKSATGNTILGKKCFESKLKMITVSKKSEAKSENVEGRNVTVVDTPGLFDTKLDFQVLVKEIMRCIYESRPGPHAFLIVLPLNRFTKQEEIIIQQIERIFGEEVAKYAIILFSHGDQLEDEHIENLFKENESLNNFVQKCGGRYHVFNNKDLENREQVRELMEKINRMVEENGGSCYSNKIYEDAEKVTFTQFLQKYCTVFLIFVILGGLLLLACFFKNNIVMFFSG